MKLLNPERFHKLVSQAWAAEFCGWDFQWLEGRMLQEEPPWDYCSLVRSRLPTTHALLDMGTGGGELLASLAPLPPNTHATETYPPNQLIAQRRLTPLGIAVHAIEEYSPLPFSDAQFDLVINRHDSYQPEEVCRILKPGGTFITQQVSGLNNLELNQALEEECSLPFTSWGLVTAITGLNQTGLKITRAETAALTTTFMDIGAVVYYLKAIPWQVKGFSPESHAAPLVRLHNIIEQQGHLSTTAHRMLIIAYKLKGQ
jgi:SAM-dependent methyltransferase